MHHPSRTWKPTLMPLIALAGLAAIGSIPLLTTTHLEAEAPLRYAVVHVHAGETLWRIAATHTPSGADVHDVVDRIIAANGMATSDLLPGQTLRIPTP